jgi:hypothetical protein
MPSRSRWLALALLLPAAAPAQSLDLMIHNTGISFGDSRVVNGLRFNFRDDRMRLVRGMNATIWSPYPDSWGGTVRGLALGLPLTGARDVSGVGVGVFGVGAARDFSGIGVALGGVGAGRDVSGIVIAGIGAGAGGNMTGFTFGGVGAGAGGDMKGITIGIIGAGAGRDMRGFTFGGIGAGAGRDMNGITIGGIGAGAGGNMTGFSFAFIGAGAGHDMKGISIGGVGAGAGHDMTGLTMSVIGAGAGHDATGVTIGGIGAGAGGTFRGLVIGGVGAGAPKLRGIALGLSAGGHDVRAGVIAPVYFKVVAKRDRATWEDYEDYGYVKGITLSSWNHIRGEQHGLSIGLLNTAWELNGVQLGVLNYAHNNPKGLRLLPIFNRKW